MSIIAKMIVHSARDFGSGALVELGCICENDLMAAYATSHEDKLFTKYSPWGEARMHLPQSARMPLEQDAYYLVVLRRDERYEGHIMHGSADFIVEARLAGITDRGEGVAKALEFVGYQNKDDTDLGRHPTSFNWRMNVDNPGATDQLIAGKDGYLIGFYPVAKFTYYEAISAAHERLDDVGEAVIGECMG